MNRPIPPSGISPLGSYEEKPDLFAWESATSQRITEAFTRTVLLAELEQRRNTLYMVETLYTKFKPLYMVRPEGCKAIGDALIIHHREDFLTAVQYFLAFHGADEWEHLIDRIARSYSILDMSGKLNILGQVMDDFHSEPTEVRQVLHDAPWVTFAIAVVLYWTPTDFATFRTEVLALEQRLTPREQGTQ